MEENGLVIQFGDIHVSEDILDVFFSCDLSKCKGACCATENASVGAPLRDTERETIEHNQAAILALLPRENREAIEHKGLSERHDIRFFTTTMPDSAQCTLATQEKGCWSCIVQRQQENLGFKKPLSCSLFPIRELMTEDGKPLLVLECWDECDPAFEKGEKDDVLVYEALKDALIQRFGTAFYQAIDDFVRSGKLAEMIEADAGDY